MSKGKGLVCVVLFLASCAPTMVVNGFTLDEYNWTLDRQRIRRQAAFDLGCPAQEVTLTVLDFDGSDATNVGASGCDNRVRYLRVRTGASEGWVRQN